MVGGAALEELNEANSAELVLRRLDMGGGNRLPLVLGPVVRHLHAAIRELRPSEAEMRQLVHFLTEIGQASDEKRQEWVLLLDLLGASALVKTIQSRLPAGATPCTPRGPFYRPDAPRLPAGADICLDGRGEPVEVSGRVLDLDGHAVAGAIIETWQANGEGWYENQRPDRQPEFNLRGAFAADAEGRFHYRTVRPGGYEVPKDGPVGQMLEALGYPLRRPAHLHFQIAARGFETITTQIFDADDPLIDEDALFGVRRSLLGRFEASDDGSYRLRFDFVMARARKGARS